MEVPVVHAEGLTKSFGEVHALAGVDLSVNAGTVLGLLGPNGAGKTTAVRILTTLLKPDQGYARVAGFDVVKDATALRAAIGLAGQYAAVDESLTGRENLELVGRLYHLPKAQYRHRTAEILGRFGLTFAADRQVKTYSGGMRRRLDLGASLVGRPQVLFLDEPTTGLDPRSRIELWDLIKELVKDGTTLLLTTQYLDEADQLSDQIAVIDAGRVIAEGTSDELKSRIGGEFIELVVADREQLARAAGEVVSLGTGGAQVENETGVITIPVAAEAGPTLLAEAIRRLDGAGVVLADLALRRPTLDDVFLSLTGRSTDQMGEGGEEPDGGRRRGRRARREAASRNWESDG